MLAQDDMFRFGEKQLNSTQTFQEYRSRGINAVPAIKQLAHLN